MADLAPVIQPEGEMIMFRLTDSSDFNQWLRDQMSERNLSLGDLAELTGGIAPEQISKWKNNYYTPNLHNAIKLVEALGGALVIKEAGDD